jgi:hypothetical protein
MKFILVAARSSRRVLFSRSLEQVAAALEVAATEVAAAATVADMAQVLVIAKLRTQLPRTRRIPTQSPQPSMPATHSPPEWSAYILTTTSLIRPTTIRFPGAIGLLNSRAYLTRVMKNIAINFLGRTAISVR